MLQSTEHQQFIERIKSVVHRLDSKAQILLFGSRVLGTARDDSDWDVLVITDVATSAMTTVRQRIRRSLYEIEWETGEVISVIVMSKQEWMRLAAHKTLFFQTVTQQATSL